MYFDLNLVEEILCLIALAVLGNQLLKPRPAPTDFTTIIGNHQGDPFAPLGEGRNWVRFPSKPLYHI
jgi:hypothetical protein